MGKGKGRRRRESNFKSSHSSAALSQLPPPPSHKDAAALPSKLRKIMQLKASSLHHHARNSELRRETKQPLKESKIKKDSVKATSSQVVTLEGKQQDAVKAQQQGQPLSDSTERVSVSSSGKRKRGEDMKMLMDKLRVAPIRKGIKEQRKRYLEEKKSKKRKLVQSNRTSLYQQELISFGEVVQAPPKLPAPVKALKQGTPSNLFQERLRLQAVEAYRQRRGWNSRPGTSIPFDHALEMSSM
ncbi:hypothetical protein O6H91_03G094900 [Diphasiastrum complanatum]|uniref:Uncharacterized protein n=2 Tax=Diphasiastrum complanatum TaxID=34168 RepID=A0ACC2E9P4_DIPCM|nr:hypothetical protein O6H91_21G030100 [Diphasiastrum complanatum]KAJ7563050.1 hypothetical protein O6H91_03G094900 [Diphasiastrum complanatum]